MKKRFLAAMLVLVMAFSSFSGFGSVEAGTESTALTEEKMKEVLVIVKGKLEVGDEYTEFDYNFNEYSGNGRYQFIWRTEDGNKYLNVSADTTGRIYSLYCYDYTNSYKHEGQLPTYIGEELIPVAEEWIVNVEPSLKGKLNLKRCSYSTYNTCYSISFVRNENGIDMNDNYVNITIDAFDKTVRSYNINWNFEVSIPNAKNLIGKEEAAKKVGENVNMILQYRLTYDAEGKEKVFLAYNPDTTYIAIDAKNGKVYREKTYWGSGTDFDEGFNEEEAKAEDTAEAGYSYNGRSVNLTDAEIGKLSDIKDIITSEDAIKLIKSNKKLYIDQNLTSANCRLYSNDGEYYWWIYLSDERPVDYDTYPYDYYRASASASIDAKTGKLLSFSASTKNYYEYTEDDDFVFTTNYSKKQCRKAFEEFVKEVEPEKFDFVKLSNTYDQKVYIYDQVNGYKDYDVTGGYSFNYGRYYKDIPFSANYITGEVEAVTGKVTRYNVNWTDAELPEPENVIGEKKAFESYISCEGFDLIYELVQKYENKSSYYGYDKEVKARLVYRTAISPNLIDAFTGKQLSWNGEEYEPAGVSYKYTDINGTKYERAIKLLADMGYGLAGSEFKPDAKITNEEFEMLLGAGGYYYGYSTGYYYDDYGNIVEDDADDVVNDDDSTVTRQEAAVLIITRMGGQKIADMDIYKTGYSDEKKIDKKYVGYVALCKGFGIMGAKSGKKFKPNNAVTRGEAAEMIIKMLTVSM